MSITPSETSNPFEASPVEINPCSNWELVVDKLSTVGNDPIPARVPKVCAAIVEKAKNKEWLGTILSSARRFQVQASIPVPGTDQRLLVQAGRKSMNPRDYRIELNPGRLGPDGMPKAFGVLDEIFEEGGIPFIRRGQATRIDIALDLIGLSVEQVVARSRKSQVHGVFSDRNGVPSTHYFGRPQNNSTAVYTKQRAEGVPSLRNERRLVPKCRGDELQFLSNPFLGVQIVHVDALRPHLNGLHPEHFFDAIRVRGFTHVLKHLPAAQRKALTAVLRDPNSSLLPAMDDVWSRWPEVLASSGLGFLVDPDVTASTSQLAAAAE
jgi:hypothetical protein